VKAAVAAGSVDGFEVEVRGVTIADDDVELVESGQIGRVGVLESMGSIGLGESVGRSVGVGIGVLVVEVADAEKAC